MLLGRCAHAKATSRPLPHPTHFVMSPTVWLRLKVPLSLLPSDILTWMWVVGCEGSAPVAAVFAAAPLGLGVAPLLPAARGVGSYDATMSCEL